MFDSDLFGYLLLPVAILFWISQIIDLVFRDTKYFENHTHKLTWFLVMIVGNLLGAIWYYNWKRNAIRKYIWRSYKKD